MGATKIPNTSADFERAVADIGSAPWRSELTVEEIGSPQRIAPYSVAISADVSEGDDDLGNGRLILLHDPAGNASWGGTFRFVSYAKAEIDIDMVADPLLPEVGWSWLMDALAEHDASYDLPSGTVTAVLNRSFGTMLGEEDRAEIEVRASWTPYLDPERGLWPHLAAWQDLLCLVSGLPPLPAGVVSLHRPSRFR